MPVKISSEREKQEAGKLKSEQVTFILKIFPGSPPALAYNNVTWSAEATERSTSLAMNNPFLMDALLNDLPSTDL